MENPDKRIVIVGAGIVGLSLDYIWHVGAD